MLKKLFSTFILIFNIAFGQTVLFQDDFGTSFSSISSTNWPTSCKTSSPSFNSSSGSCAGTGDYGVYLYNNQYLTTKGINIPAGGATLTFEYSFGSFSGTPSVQIGTGGWSCSSASYTIIQSLGYSSSCSTMTIDLSSYAGQTVYIRFQAGNSWTSFYLDNVKVTSSSSSGGGGGSCGNCIGSNCLTSTANGLWTDCNTWQSGFFCTVWSSFTMSTRYPVINSNVTVSGYIPTNKKNCKSIYINPGATLTFNTSYPGNTSSGIQQIEVCGTLNINSGTVDFREFELIIHNGGVVNMNGGTFIVRSVLIENGGILNLNGGDLQRSCGSYSAVGLEIQQGGLMNINSSSARFSNYSCFSTPYTILDGTIDCKNSLSSSNYTNIKLGNVRVSNNTSTGRIRTQTANVPMAEWGQSAGNNFWGFNSTYGGTVEYYGNNTIFLNYSSRYNYYDLEVNNTGGVYLHRETDVVGILYLKKGNIHLNGKRLVLRGKVNYTGSYAINGNGTGSTVEVVGKLSGSYKDSGLSTYLISSQGTDNINVRNIALKFTMSPLDTLRLWREDVVLLQTPVYINGQLQLDRGILRTDATNYPTIQNPASNAVRHKTKGYRTLYGFISGYLYRRMNPGNSYDFPVGYPNMTEYYQGWDVTKPLPKHRLLTIDFKAKTINPTQSSGLLVNFVPSISTCSGTLTNAVESTGETYTQLHPEGKWQAVLTPAEPGETFDYDAKLHTWGFDSPSLTNNLYAPLKRPDGSTSCADWTTGGGTMGTPNQLGRIILTNSAGMDTSYAIRKNLSSFSEFAIGIIDATTLPAINLAAVKIAQNTYKLNVNISQNTYIIIKDLNKNIIQTMTPDKQGNAILKITRDVFVQAKNSDSYSNEIFLHFSDLNPFALYVSENIAYIKTPEIGNLFIKDISGKTIAEFTISKDTEIDLNNYPKGVYLVEFRSPNYHKVIKSIIF